MQQWPLHNPPSGSSVRSCFWDAETPETLCVGLPPNPGPAPAPAPPPDQAVRQEAAWFSHYFQPDSFWKARHAVDPAPNTEAFFLPLPRGSRNTHF